MKKKVIIFIDRIASKNILQLKSIHLNKLNFTCFVESNLKGPNNYLEEDDSLIVTKKNIFKRIGQAFKHLSENRHKIHHVEIYPGSYFSFLYLFISKVLRIKTICVERGDLLYFNKNGYNILTRFSMWLCYKYSTIVWYREPYMKTRLENMKVKNLYFLHNSIENNKANSTEEIAINKDITFLWLNRIIPERKYKWFINIVKSPELQNTQNYMIGLMQQRRFVRDEEFVLKNAPLNLKVLDYTNDAVSYFRRAKFFVLPSDVVFANHTLMEAMRFGVVPLVSDRPGSSLIVEDGINGFLFNHDENDFKKAVLKAINLSTTEYQGYSQAAKNKIAKNFSEEQYHPGLSRLYEIVSLM